MRKELDEELCHKYPEIFQNRQEDMQTTTMCWGFECGDGWYNIIDAACAQIENHLENQRRLHKGTEHIPMAVIASQVKEKYGTLRFYVWGGDEYVDGIIDMAEALSARTCETCGAPGKLREGGWLKTLCDEHAKHE